MKNQILLIEDNQELNDANRRALELKGHSVYTVNRLQEAKEYLDKQEPDIILLDVMLPDGDGFDFCQEIRETIHSTIIFLTAKNAHEDKVKGLLGGGDDYITKPFHPEELLARVEVALRRKKREAEKYFQTYGPLKIDPLTATVMIRNRRLNLTKAEYILIYTFLQAKNKIVTKDVLIKAITSNPKEYDYRSLWQHISRLNKKMAHVSDGEVKLAALRGEGYYLDY